MQFISIIIHRSTVCSTLLALLIIFCFFGCVTRPPLHEAAFNNDIGQINTLINKGVDVNYSEFKTGTAITAAIYQSHFDGVKALINHGADINKPSFISTNKPQYYVFYGSSLMMASLIGDVSIVELLLKSGADVTRRIDKLFPSFGQFKFLLGYNSLFFAEEGNHLDVARMLLKHGADPNVKLDDFPIAYIAAYRNHVDFIIALLENGLEIEVVPQYPSPLAEVSHIAADFNAEINPEKAVKLYKQAVDYYLEGAKTLEINANWKDTKNVFKSAFLTTASYYVAREQAIELRQTLHNAAGGSGGRVLITFSYPVFNITNLSTTDYMRAKAQRDRDGYKICQRILECHEKNPEKKLIECVEYGKLHLDELILPQKIGNEVKSLLE